MGTKEMRIHQFRQFTTTFARKAHRLCGEFTDKEGNVAFRLSKPGEWDQVFTYNSVNNLVTIHCRGTKRILKLPAGEIA